MKGGEPVETGVSAASRLVTPQSERREHPSNGRTMPQYMLLMYQPAEGGPRNAASELITSREDMAEEHQRWLASL